MRISEETEQELEDIEEQKEEQKETNKPASKKYIVGQVPIRYTNAIITPENKVLTTEQALAEILNILKA
jgi:hypothetical protein